MVALQEQRPEELRPPGEIAFVGLGNIGLPLCARLTAAGHRVRAFDISTTAIAAAVRAGAAQAHSLRDADAADVVFTCLPTPTIVADVVAGANGILSSKRGGRVLVDLSTNDPAVVRDLAAQAAASGSTLLDAPVAGGVPGARAGTLTIMVGGDKAAFERVLPLLRQLGSHVFHLGPAGSGNVAKIANNYLAFANLVAAAEAFITAKRAGVTPDRLLEVLAVGSGGSVVLERYRRKVLPRNFDAEFTIDLAFKDLGLALDLGDRHRVPLPFGSALKVWMQQSRALGDGDLDVSALVRVAERLCGEEIGG